MSTEAKKDVEVYMPPNLNTPGYIPTCTGHVLLEAGLVGFFGWKRNVILTEDQECAVCLVNMKGYDYLLQTSCDHVFHRYCILKIMASANKEKRVCPLCRYALGTSKKNCVKVNNISVF
jgi:hypothetical protein